MTNPRQKTRRSMLICGAAVAAVLAASPALAQDQIANIDIAAQPMDQALKELAKQSGANLLFSPDAVRGLRAKSLQTTATPQDAARMLLAGTDLFVKKDATGSLLVDRADPQSGSAAGDGADGTVAALIVTAQKREENIQDVPIAISAFSQKTLEEQKIEGGFDLLKAIPNVTFSKNNFTSYNFSIRGIGTKAVSATTDPGVAVSFNNIALLQNRLFEQEYFDVERVEVLRGPQGTLYGRNATAGVINVISAKPNLHEFDGWVKGEVGNYHAKRVSAMVNIPLVQDKLGIRIAGALTDRQGYDYNEGTHHAVNGRDLWSGRVTVAFNPTDSVRTNLIWERFNEDDDRSRTGKQLCHHDSGPTEIAGVSTASAPGAVWQWTPLRQALFSQGCLPGSLYNDGAFGTPNGLALPFVYGMLAISNLYGLSSTEPLTLIKMQDPYGGMMQSRDLRVITSFKDPVYRAKADVVELNFDWNLNNTLTFSSQTAYNKDSTYSFQDYNRFNTLEIFSDSTQFDYNGWNPFGALSPGGEFCDPQLGCSKTMAGFDIAEAKGEQLTQEFRLQSSFDGPLNFSVGANYTRFHTLVDYYVFNNLITAFALIRPFNFAYSIDQNTCGIAAYAPFFREVPRSSPDSSCPYIDPNPIESIDGQGHNYFRSKNPYRLKSAAAFGELYWQIDQALKLTAGLRYTDDRKTFIPVPTQILLAPGPFAAGDASIGYPEDPAIKQHWGEWTGRLGVDWKPDLSFTDQSLLYAFYSHGYKAGGANPPTPGFTKKTYNEVYSAWIGFDVDFGPGARFPMMQLLGVDYGPTFKPEFVNAFEIGSKNTLSGGALTLNGDAFFYDYKDYQVSQIKNRTAVNENFDARAWGLEFETMFAPTRNLQLVANLGYLDTAIADGETSIDIMNRTQGNPNFVVTKPWVQLPSNCIIPVGVADYWLTHNADDGGVSNSDVLCPGNHGIMGVQSSFNEPILDPATQAPYDANYYNGQNGTVDINGGAGIKAQLGGKELPNAPHWTMNIGAQYGHDILDGSWRATVRADAYWQSQSWARVYNLDPYDKLHGWYNMNLSVWFERPENDLKIELYAKNILDKTPITDAFLNSDDSALTTNVFVLDPRLIGLSIKKGF